MDTALQSSVYVSSPEFAGWLNKRGFHWRKLWKKRWVALHGAEIVYMEKEPTLENSGNMTITKAQITTATVIDREDLEGNPNGFAIHINDGHTPTWYLRAESAREKKSWLMRLSHVHTIVRWLEDFEKVKVLGVGGTGIVYELLHKSNGSRFAMKEMEIKNKAQMQMAISEAEMLKDIMENVSHPNVMHIEKVFQVGSKFYLVFPLCTGGELYEHIIRRGHFTERDAAFITRDLISGLYALHCHDILHLDIKPENLLFDSMNDDARIKITDFGLSKLFSEPSTTNPTSSSNTPSSSSKAQKGGTAPFSMALLEEKLRLFMETGELNRDKLRGTIGYMSPELILCGYCCKGTDVFAAGVVLYILLCGRPPFNSKSNREVLERTARGQYNMSGAEWDEISEEAKDLVRRMLVVNPEERISCADILAHPWLRMLDAMDEESVSLSSQSSSSLSLSQHQHLMATSSANTSTNTSTTGMSLSYTPSNTSQQRRVFSSNTRGLSHTNNGQNSGHNTVNLASALRHLSGHVKQRQSEKLATSVTRLVSLMQQSHTNNGSSLRSSSTLAAMYLIPTQMQDIETIAKTQSANQAEDAELDSVLLNTDFREGLSRALQRLASSSSTSSATSGEIEGRITLEQFMVVLRQLYSLNGHSYSNNNNNSNNESGIVDVPRSSESAGASAAGTQTPSHPSSTQNSHPPQTPTSSQTSGSTQTPSGSQNVGGLGLGPLIISRFIDRDNDGYITADDIFAAQALVLQRSESFLRVVFRLYAESVWYPGRQLNLQWMLQQTPMRGNDTSGHDNNSGGDNNSNAVPILSQGSAAPYLQAVVEPPKHITQRHVSAVFEKLGYDGSCGAKVFGVLAEALQRLKRQQMLQAKRSLSDDEEDNEGDESAAGEAGDRFADEGVSFGRSGRTPRSQKHKLPQSFDEAEEEQALAQEALAEANNNNSSFRLSQSTAASSSKKNLALAAAFAEDSAQPSATASNANNTINTAVQNAASSQSTSNSGSKAATTSPTVDNAPLVPAASYRMDFQDFVKCCVELDDVLLQAIFRKSRFWALNLVQEVETRVRHDQHQQQRQQSTDRTTFSEDPRARSSSNGHSSLRAREIAAQLIEDDLKGAFQQLRLQEERARQKGPAFPLANAVGRALGGFAAKVLGSDADNNNEADSNNHHSNSSHNTHNTSNSNTASRQSLGRRSFFSSSSNNQSSSTQKASASTSSGRLSSSASNNSSATSSARTSQKVTTPGGLVRDVDSDDDV